MSQTKPPPWHHSTAGQLFWWLFSAGLPRGGVKTDRISCRYFLPNKLAKGGKRAGWIVVWSSSLTGWKKSAQFRTRIVSDVLILSYLHKIGLSLMVEAGQALAVLYSKARLFKGPRLSFSVDCYTFYRQHLRVDTESRPQQHTWNSEFFFSFPLQITAALSLHFQHLYED